MRKAFLRKAERTPIPVIPLLPGKFLFPLAQRSTKFPRAKWFCRLCEYHCDNLAKVECHRSCFAHVTIAPVQCWEHITEPRHQRLTRTKELDDTLRQLPPPNRNHLDCLNALLVTVEKEQGLSHSDISSRQAVASVVRISYSDRQTTN